MQDSRSPIYISAAEHHGAPGEAAKRIHEIGCPALVGNRHVQYYIGTLRLEILAIFGKTSIITVHFRRSAGGRLALAVVESDDFVPELNQVFESGLTDEAGRADREDAHRLYLILMTVSGARMAPVSMHVFMHCVRAVGHSETTSLQGGKRIAGFAKFNTVEDLSEYRLRARVLPVLERDMLSDYRGRIDVKGVSRAVPTMVRI